MRKRVVFRGKFFTVRQWRQRLPGGKTELYEQAERPGSVMVFPVDGRGNLILIREIRFNMRRFIWNAVSGRVDRERSPLVAAKRELAEEASLQARRWTKLWEKEGRSGLIAWHRTVYLARDLLPAHRDGDPFEVTRPVSLPLRRAYQLALNGKISAPDVAYFIIRLWHNRKRWLRR